MRFVALLFVYLIPVLPAIAEPVWIDGPAGPLSAEMIAVDGADHMVVIVPGSGPIDRDGNSPQMGLHSDSYKMLADGLAAAGIATLRIDKRGFFGSEAAISDPNDVTIAAYAKDAGDWVERAAQLARCVWIAGHSEGGLVALVAAQSSRKHLCGLILMATSGRPIGVLLREQMRAIPGSSALMPEIDATVTELEAGRTRDPSTLSPSLRTLFSSGLQRYMIDLFSYDPVAIAHRWAGPTLIIQGDADMQVKPLDADLLAAVLPQAERANLSGATHMLKSDVPGQPYATYTDSKLPLHPDLLPAIKAFLSRNPPQ